MNDRLDDGAEPWPLRPWLMAGICAAAGLGFHFLTYHHYPDPPITAWRQAAATFVAIVAISFVLTVERRRWVWAAAFALAGGIVIALVGWFTARYNLNPTIFEWPYLSGLFAVTIAAPLFQTIRDEGRRSLPYFRLHGHAWADAVIGGASLAFTGIVFMFAGLIAGLFDLIGIELIKDLLQKDWFDWVLAGFAFGASVGLLRERDRLLPMLQRLLRIILAVLAPPLAVALILFLASIPFTGLEKFWKSGVPATPLLLLAGAGAILLANTVFAEDAESRSRSPVLRWSSLLLVAVVLPLAGIAALSLGIRINQYGWTPERIWGVVAVVIAIAYGLAGWYAILRARLEFNSLLRPLQTRLAVGLCCFALLLALPLIDFGAISAHSQLTRLQSGKISAAKFDWSAMAFNFGPAGRSELQRITQSGSAETRSMAVTALKAKSRFEASEEKLVAGPRPSKISILPNSAIVPSDLRDLLLRGAKGEDPFCSEGGACRVFPQPDGASYVVLMDGCANLPDVRRNDPNIPCTRSPGIFEKQNGKWTNIYSPGYAGIEVTRTLSKVASLKQESDAIDRGDVHIEPVQKRQLVIGGKPVGSAF